MIHSVRKSCAVCRNTDLIEAISLPKLPLTGIYVEKPDSTLYQGIDQGLLLCPECGHAQLKNFLEPDVIYGDIYFHRTSDSPLSRTGNDFFAQFLLKTIGSQKFECILEIGCNDLYLLNRIREIGRHCYGLDPIWKTDPIPETPQNVKILGKFVEELDFKTDVVGRPDLIISAHTFEHVEDPRSQLEKIVENAADEALVFIEVPGFDNLLANLRFDQVFHQHIHYFGLGSMNRMIQELGCEYVGHDFNYRYWGGTMLVAFKKSKTRKVEGRPLFPHPDLNLLASRYKLFQRQLNSCAEVLETLKNETIYAFGAAQMLPTISYHLRNDFSSFAGILDDNETRWNLYYPGLSTKIGPVNPEVIPTKSNVLVTALDSVRPIMKRLTSLEFKRILLPISLIT